MLLDPLAIVGEAGANTFVPVEVLESVSVRVASVEFGFPNWSSRTTVMLLEATPAIVDTSRTSVITSLVAAAAVIVYAPLVPLVSPEAPAEKVAPTTAPSMMVVLNVAAPLLLEVYRRSAVGDAAARWRKRDRDTAVSHRVAVCVFNLDDESRHVVAGSRRGWRLSGERQLRRRTYPRVSDNDRTPLCDVVKGASRGIGGGGVNNSMLQDRCHSHWQ